MKQEPGSKEVEPEGLGLGVVRASAEPEKGRLGTRSIDPVRGWARKRLRLEGPERISEKYLSANFH